MFRWLKFGIIGIYFLFLSNNSFALIDVQALVGSDSGTISGGNAFANGGKTSGTVMGVAVHLDPIPLVPVGFGIGIGAPTLKSEDSGIDETYTGFFVDLEVMAWTPIGFFGITPYAKLGYRAYGLYEMKNSKANIGGTIQEIKIPLETSGTKFAVGARYSLLPLIGLLLEVSSQKEELKVKSVEVNGVDLSLPGSLDRSATSIMLGVEVGI